MKKNIPIADPVREIKELNNIEKEFISELFSGVYIGGKNVKQLEENLKNFFETKFVITTNSGTDALILSMSQLHLRPEDEVIIPSFTFFATAEAAMHFKYKLNFVDLNPDDFTISENSFFQSVNQNTKAFIPVHLFGKYSISNKIVKFCKENQIQIIEDCAQSFGSMDGNGDLLGTLGNYGCFSFFPSKTLGGIGDGGCIITDNQDTFEKLKKVKNHGQDSLYDHEIMGVNSRLDSLNAFILEKKLNNFMEIKDERIKLANFYLENINNHLITVPQFEKNEVPNYFPLIIKNGNRDKFIKYLEQNYISNSVYYKKPLHKQTALIEYGFTFNDLSNTEKLSEHIISIPFFSYMENEEKYHIVETINNFK